MPILLRTQVDRTDKTPVTARRARVGGLCGFRSPAERVSAGSPRTGRCADVRGCCAYPDAPCRHPDKMFPCVESQGILVTDLAEKHGLDFMNGNIVVWFSLILFK